MMKATKNCFIIIDNFYLILLQKMKEPKFFNLLIYGFKTLLNEKMFSLPANNFSFIIKNFNNNDLKLAKYIGIFLHNYFID